MTSETPNRSNRKPTAKQEFKQAQFINHTFSEPDKARFKAWLEEHADDIWNLVDKAVEGSYKLTVKYDDYAGCAAAFLQTSNEKDRNYGFILTGRSHSGAVAVASALYRHFVLFEGDWPTETVRRSVLDDE